MHQLKDDKVHAFLQELIAEGPAEPKYGLCYAFSRIHRLVWLGNAFEHLGLDGEYPVPSGTLNIDAQWAYSHTSRERMWDTASRYGANRWALVYALADLANGIQVSSVDWPYPETGAMED